MRWFKKGEPTLTVSARTISAIVDGLDEDGKRRATHTVRSLIEGIRGMSSLPPGVTGELWTILVTFGRKVMMTSVGFDDEKTKAENAAAAAEQCMAEVRDGLSPGLVSMVEKEARR